MADESAAIELQKNIQSASLNITVLAGDSSIVELIEDANYDAVMVAIVGAVGILPSIAAVKQGKQVMIANKEPLVMAGDLFMAEARKSGVTILPIDSEHNAIFQCLPYPFGKSEQVQIEQLVLTASGGPFRGRKWAELKDITPAQAIAHPNWSMGAKISVDSATMMNKGLELIEATHLFDLTETKIDILIHPQSIIHSMVEYIDGSCLAQLGSPDMCVPIAHAMAWPERMMSGAQRLNLAEIARLDFQEPDYENVPCLKLARQVAAEGGSAPAVMNAANEIAVDAFIKKKIGYVDIYTVVDKVVQRVENKQITELQDVLSIDEVSRHYHFSDGS